jgi:DNA mismatch repair protein MutL
MILNDNKISVLPEILANKIAAGEVVERPSSVVKELIENSIDAGATNIRVFIEQGGKKLIQVIDDGCGIGEEFIPLAFQRHATSKIKSEDDLAKIYSLGFRGEALPSIASVSQVEIKTKSAGSKMGYIYSCNGGGEGSIKKLAANIGTSISVKNLFYNTPARQKFLKSDSAENQHILMVLKRFFLACADIEFELTIEGKQLYLLKKVSLKERVADIFGNTIAPELIELENSIGGIRIFGFIGKPTAARRSRSHQHLFLNGRPILDRNINYAIYQGYGETLEEGAHPLYCLFIEMDPAQVDVNIHPTKMQVRFSNDRNLFYLFLNVVKTELNNKGILSDISAPASGSAVQKVIIDNQTSEQKDESGFSLKKVDLPFFTKKHIRKSGQLSLAYFSAIEQAKSKENKKLETYDETTDATNSEPDIKETVGVRLWQVHRKYIFSEIRSGLVVIDQHLAHTRILFEKTLKVLKNKSRVNAQKLLFPQKITLALDDFLTFNEIYLILKKIGFTITVFSGNTIIIEEMPSDVKIGRESQILMDIIDFYKNTPLSNYELNEKIAAGYAFKNAIKNGEELSEIQMHNLVDQLFACEHPFYAPNGKPVIISLELDELSKRFK